MTRLADAFATFLGQLNSALPSLADHLRFPREQGSSLRGSELGRALWALPEGQDLLTLTTMDPDVRAAVGAWPVVREVRMILGSAVGRWQESGTDLQVFAYENEDALWASLRRPVVRGRAVCVAEGITTSEVLTIGSGLQLSPPDEEILESAFTAVWPEYSIHLPANPHALLISVTQHERSVFSGVTGPANAWVFGIPDFRELIWLATGRLPRLHHGVAFDDDPFPIAQPIHMNPEFLNHPGKGSVNVAEFKTALAALADRFDLILGRGGYGDGMSLDSETLAVLLNIRLQLSGAIDGADPRLALQYAFAAADGSLLDRNEDAALVARRFAWLVGDGDTDTREIRRSVEHLKAIRDALAHGDTVTNQQIASFLGAEEPAPEGEPSAPWKPPPWDGSTDAARLKGLNLLRRLFRSWLLVAIAQEAGSLRVGLSRDEVRGLLRAAQASREPVERIRALTQIAS